MALPDHNLHTAAVTAGLYDRLELSHAWQGFYTGTDSWRGRRQGSIRVMMR